jgi:hypothetical protein
MADQVRYAELMGHVLKVVDRGWCFVHQTIDEPLFRIEIEKLDRLPKINGEANVIKGVAVLEDILRNMVDIGWDHVHIMFASNTTKDIFARARAEVGTVYEHQSKPTGMKP